MVNNKKRVFFIISLIYVLVGLIIFFIFNSLIDEKSQVFLIVGMVLLLFSLIVIFCVEDFFFDCRRSIREFIKRIQRRNERKSTRKNLKSLYKITNGFSNMWYLVLVFISLIIVLISTIFFIRFLNM